VRPPFVSLAIVMSITASLPGAIGPTGAAPFGHEQVSLPGITSMPTFAEVSSATFAQMTNCIAQWEEEIAVGAAGRRGSALALPASDHPTAVDVGVYPDPTLTPGLARSDDVPLICATPTRDLRHWSRKETIASCRNTTCRPDHISAGKWII
jgi:hypothetical protein